RRTEPARRRRGRDAPPGDRPGRAERARSPRATRDRAPLWPLERARDELARRGQDDGPLGRARPPHRARGAPEAPELRDHQRGRLDLSRSSPMSVLIGISSWTEPTLIKRGHFYPKGVTTAEERLKFYATQFPIVEVDSTYYFPPSERNAVLWLERTPKDFVFT